MRWWLIALAIASLIAAPAKPAERNEWYWNSPVNIHWDNHGRPLGQGMSPDEIAKMFDSINVDMIQVSACSGHTTYPSKVGVPNPELNGYDTMATWREVTRQLGTKMWVYINVIDAAYLVDKHPDWRRIDAQGDRTRVCNRPSADGTGWLESYMLPLIAEIAERYDPDGFWFDGDWQIPDVCYCVNCKAAWRELTGKDEPPRDATHPDWPRWVALEQARRDQYKQKMATAIHEADPDCCYVSNWSWAISQRDPRTAPPFADTLSGDVGAGSSNNALYSVRFAAMMLSAQEHTPHDVMSAIYPKKIRTLPRMLQEGGLVMSGGASWFLWVNRLTPDQFAHLRTCHQLIDSRRDSLGRTHSLNPVAVLLSETTWQRGLGSSEPGYFDHDSPRNWAFALQDAGFGVDVVNEQTLREQIDRLKVVVVANQRQLAPQTLEAVGNFVQSGGTLVVTDGALLADPTSAEGDTATLLGMTRTSQKETPKQCLAVDGRTVPVRVPWHVEPQSAEVLATLIGSDAPVLTIHRQGRGRVAYAALAGMTYPDEDGLAIWLTKKLGLGPMVSVAGSARQNDLVFSLRRRGERQTVLHISDLTTHAGGRRVEPNSTHEIDPVRPIPEIDLQLALATAPTSIRVLPAETKAAWTSEQGRLKLRLTNFQTHAAVVLETAGEAAPGLLPETVQPTEPRRYPAPSVIIDQSFNDTQFGKFPDDPQWSANTDGKTSIRVARDPASANNRVLEFVDSPDARKAFVPYLVISPRRLDRGRARFACRLRMEPEARLNLEARDTSRGKLSPGPSVRITDSGDVVAAGRTVTKVPSGQWFGLELEFGLGFSPSEYRLAIQFPDGHAEHFDGLAYRSPEFSRCTWLGITSDAAAATKIYLDDVKLKRLPEHVNAAD